MKRVLITFCLAIVVVGAGLFYYYNKKITELSIKASNHVLQQLREGNERFASGNPLEHDYEKQILNTKKVATPEAIVLSCMDSRNIPELSFDQGIGEIFAIRIAGNVINSDILGSMEYATKIAGARLIVVLGHTKCAAIIAACNGDKLGNLTTLLQQIQPAVQAVKTAIQKNNCKDPALIDAIEKQNVINMMQKIPQQSPIIARLIKDGKVKIVGGMYDVSNGRVTFFE